VQAFIARIIHCQRMMTRTLLPYLALLSVSLIAQHNVLLADAIPCGESHTVAAAGLPGVKLGHLFDWTNQEVLANKFWTEDKIGNNTFTMWDSFEQTALEVQSEQDRRGKTLALEASIELKVREIVRESSRCLFCLLL
jgi:hypothetical protein